MQHLGDEREVRDAGGPTPVVVGRDERRDELLDLRRGRPGDPLDPGPDEALVRGGDDDELVGEAVEPERIQAELPIVRRVEGVDAAVPVALAEERRQSHELDEAPVVVQVAEPLGERLRFVPEVLLGDRVPGVGMVRLDAFEEDVEIVRVPAPGVGHRRGRGRGRPLVAAAGVRPRATAASRRRTRGTGEY